MTSDKRKVILITSSLLAFPIMTLVFLATTTFFGIRGGYFTGFAFYWAYCLSVVLALQNNQGHSLRSEIAHLKLSKRNFVWIMAACAPVFPVMYIQFFPHADSLVVPIVMLAIGNAIINGSVEELYWRGLYLSEFAHNPAIGIWLATILFGAWHCALYFIDGIDYGGFWPLVGGAAFMGFWWSICSRKLGNIVPGIIAHIVVNLFAFYGLYIENGF